MSKIEIDRILRTSYLTTVDNIARHFLKIILEEKQPSFRLETDVTTNKYKIKPPWFLNETELCIRANYDTNTSGLNPDSGSTTFKILLARVFSERSENALLFANIPCNLFLNELKMLQEIVPAMETLLEFKIGPQLYHHSNQFKILFVENLLTQGYHVKSFDKGMSYKRCSRAIQLMASLHAASVALHEKDSELVKAFNITEFITNYGHHLKEIFYATMKKVSAFMMSINSEIANKIELALDIICTEQIIEMLAYQPEEFCVLNNGDFSITNLYFQDIEDSHIYTLFPLMQHYQVAHYSSPAIDLHYFLNTSPKVDVLYDYDERLLERYLKTLTSTMKTLNCMTKPPTMEQLKAAMKKREMYAVFAGMTFRLSMMTDLVEKENIYRDDNMINKLACKMCTIMYHRGYFDKILEFCKSDSSDSPKSEIFNLEL